MIYISYVQPFGDFFPTTQGVGPWKLSCKRILNGVDYVNRKPFRLGPGVKLQLHHQHQQRQFLMVTQVRSTGFLRRFKPVYSILVDHFLWRTTTCSTLGALGLKKHIFSVRCLDIGARKKTRKVIVKKVKKKEGGEKQKEEDHKQTAFKKSQTADSDATLPFEIFPSGGDSQWRQEAEDQWENWRWPPVGWKPSKGQHAYHDESSSYYRFNTYDWDAYNKRIRFQLAHGDGEPTTSPGSRTGSETPSTSLDRKSSHVNDVSTIGPSASLLAAQLARSTTGDMSLLEKFDQVAAEESPENVMKIALQEKARAEEMMKKAKNLCKRQMQLR